MIMRTLHLEESKIGVKIGRKKHLLHADDTTLHSETREGLKHLIKKKVRMLISKHQKLHNIKKDQTHDHCKEEKYQHRN